MAELVLIAEDDDLLRGAVVAHLQAAGYSTIDVEDGGAALNALRTTKCDLIILDRRMSGLDGLTTLTSIRARGIRTPVMFLTAAGSLDERVRGLDAGADDYLAKPFEAKELLARVRALLRRPADMSSDIVEARGVRLDRTARRAFVDGVEVSLTAQDFELLETLVRHPDRTFTRETLHLRVGGSADASPTAVEHAVSRLRRKTVDACGRDVIATIRGAGYRLAVSS